MVYGTNKFQCGSLHNFKRCTASSVLQLAKKRLQSKRKCKNQGRNSALVELENGLDGDLVEFEQDTENCWIRKIYENYPSA